MQGTVCCPNTSMALAYWCKQPVPGPSNRSALVAFAGLQVAGGDLLEGAGIIYADFSMLLPDCSDTNTPVSWGFYIHTWTLCDLSFGPRTAAQHPKYIKLYRHRPQIALQEKLDTMARAGDKLGRHPTQSGNRMEKVNKTYINHLITASASNASKKMTRRQRQPRAKL